MPLKLAIPALGAALLSLNGCYLDDWGARYNQDFHYSYPIQPGGTLSLDTFNGSVDLSGWDQNTIDVSGTKYGPSQTAAEHVKVDIVNTADSVSIHVSRPGDVFGGRGARFRIRMPWKTHIDRITTNNGPIDLLGGTGPGVIRTTNGQVHVTQFGGQIDVRTANGQVELRDVQGDAMVRTTNGHIRADDVHGSFDAATTNGGITARIDARPDAQRLRLATFNGSIELTLSGSVAEVKASTGNGSITLRLPQSTNARVFAHTGNAAISSDFPVRMTGESRRNQLEGVIGNGGPLLDLSTWNAPIRLLQM